MRKFDELLEEVLTDPEFALEYYKTHAEVWKHQAQNVRRWKYDEPPKDDELILGYFLPTDGEEEDPREFEGVCLAYWDGEVWATGLVEHKDCQLLCWQPVDWEV